MINELITYKFDFTDEEVLAYYISFVKTISLKLNAHTIQFFFNPQKDFPLFDEPIKFFNSTESMVRVAVRTLTLNVFKVESAREYVFSKQAAPYYNYLLWFLSDQIHKFNYLICANNPTFYGRICDTVDELLDLFYYLHDTLSMKIEKLSQVLSENLLCHVLMPILVDGIFSQPKVINKKEVFQVYLYKEKQLSLFLIVTSLFLS